MTNPAKIEKVVQQTPLVATKLTPVEEVLLKQQKLQALKGKLDGMIDLMARNPSFLSRASTYWGEIPLWQKIVIGIVLIVPAMVISFVFQLILLFTISSFVLFIYTASSLLLDEHHTQSKDRTASLKTGISGLSEMLGEVILSFVKLREELAAEVESFKKENTTLKQSVTHFEGQVTELTQKVKALEGVVQSLQKTAHDLGVERDRALKTVQQQSKLLEENQELLKQAGLSLVKTQEELSQKITALTETNKGLSTELTQTKAVANILNDSVTELAKFADLTPEQVTAFKSKIIQFINNKEESFLLIAQQLSETGRKFALTQMEMDEALKHLRGNIIRGANLERRLENATSPPASGTAALLTQFGVNKFDAKVHAAAEGSSQLGNGM